MKNKKLIFVGIIEKYKNRISHKFVEGLLVNNGFRLVHINEKRNIRVYTAAITIVLLDIDLDNIEAYDLVGLEIDILIHNFLREDDYRQGLINNIFKNTDYYIINSDDENWSKLPLKESNGIIISYGFNNKASLTISSFNLDSHISANICLQRKIHTIEGEKLEPFEYSINIDSDNKDTIYPFIAASALILVLGYEKLNL